MPQAKASFDKKEREKKKEKKKKDKAKKKAERQSKPKNSSFESMIAYVDKFGRITDTPPVEEKPESESKLLNGPKHYPRPDQH